jgi:putative transposase
LGLSRSAYYYQARPVSEEDLWLMQLIDEEYTRHPLYECRQSLASYFQFYNHERRHQSLDCRTPSDVYQAGA